ncbi:hypothetical protein [Thermococcus barossii]|uniref:Uncharacterized protein n=1 Tax=Thermococcus barossii TaxID=54077 RepID=A0A2Z2MJ93_9EURY|nr:hypothetical protein [Thermococcus barossii]ASJ03894.1 hypothetical protein A3L01_00355 [Thermococcus barossii]
MRAGTPRTYTFLMFIALLIFTASVLLREPVLVAAFLILLSVGILAFYGREVRVERGRVILEWGVLLKHRREITSTEILDIIDAPSSRYLVLAKYRPGVLLLPVSMVGMGLLILLFSENGWIGLGWILLGTIELANHVLSAERRKMGAVGVLLMTGALMFVGYFIAPWKTVLPVLAGFLMAGVLMAASLWSSGPLIGNTLIIVAERGVYSVSYTSRSELKQLISALEGGE